MPPKKKPAQYHAEVNLELASGQVIRAGSSFSSEVLTPEDASSLMEYGAITEMVMKVAKDRVSTADERK